MRAADLAKISADAHVDEPHDLWYERLPESLREGAPRRIQSNNEGGWTLVVNGDAIGWDDASVTEARALEADRSAAASPRVRFEMMRRDGVSFACGSGK